MRGTDRVIEAGGGAAEDRVGLTRSVRPGRHMRGQAISGLAASGEDLHHPADGVGSIQTGSRTAQDFDVINL